ncbi:YqjF family protein [Okibacterium fritillariae]|uniref:DUF2071 domain-containing protein n=1 Tax=Okibacterium fritillariae TaxID=123320 RepID=A0A1T5IZ73_9MICO|nr:DUF2071 domain-containing protein [Okibacterium fritillariae]SKC44434.1 hypothetical protein SAMN06309945_1021 [Okibacterium fritillariae]
MSEPATATWPDAPELPGRAVIAQRWSDLTFLHWRVDPAEVAPLLPPGTRPDVIDGSSWVGLIAFRLSDSAFFGLPPVPYFGTFPEINVRLYSIDAQGRRAVVFASLDASRLVSVLTARAAFGLPYRWARMSMGQRSDDRGELFAYRSRRHLADRLLGDKRNPGHVPGASTHLIARALPGAVAGDPIAEFLTARWAFHETHLGRTWFGSNHHGPWPLQRAELLHLDDTLLEAAGFASLADTPPDSVLYSPGVETVFSRPTRLSLPARRR